MWPQKCCRQSTLYIDIVLFNKTDLPVPPIFGLARLGKPVLYLFIFFGEKRNHNKNQKFSRSSSRMRCTFFRFSMENKAIGKIQTGKKENFHWLRRESRGHRARSGKLRGKFKHNNNWVLKRNKLERKNISQQRCLSWYVCLCECCTLAASTLNGGENSPTMDWRRWMQFVVLFRSSGFEWKVNFSSKMLKRSYL